MGLSKEDKEFITTIIDQKVTHLAQMITFHLNMNTDVITLLDRRLNGIQSKAAIGFQARKKSWEPNHWGSVVLFHGSDVSLPKWGDDWEFRFVYVDIK